MIFKIDKPTNLLIETWKAEQVQKDNSNYVSGERWTYSFTPSGLGMLIIVRDDILNEEKDFTDYDSFG